MGKTLAVLLFSLFAICGQAQDTTLKQYVGKYVFPEGSIVTSAEIYLEGGNLAVNSARGSSPMEKRAKDTFALTSFDGMAYFQRNKEGKVSGIRVEVGDILLEGTKDAGTAWIQRNKYLARSGQPVVK